MFSRMITSPHSSTYIFFLTSILSKQQGEQHYTTNVSLFITVLLIKMAYVRIAQRPVFSNQQMNPRPPIYQQPPPPAVARNQLPRHLPVLNPPYFPKENEFYEEEEQQQQQQQYEEEVYNYPTMLISDQHGIITQQFSAYRSFPNYPKQQLIHPIIPRHPAYMYYHH